MRPNSRSSASLGAIASDRRKHSGWFARAAGRARTYSYSPSTLKVSGSNGWSPIVADKVTEPNFWIKSGGMYNSNAIFFACLDSAGMPALNCPAVHRQLCPSASYQPSSRSRLFMRYADRSKRNARSSRSRLFVSDCWLPYVLNASTCHPARSTNRRRASSEKIQ